MKVGDLVRVFGTTQRLQNKIGLIVGRDSKSDTMQMGRDGDFFYTMYYKVVIDGHVPAWPGRCKVRLAGWRNP